MLLMKGYSLKHVNSIPKFAIYMIGIFGNRYNCLYSLEVKTGRNRISLTYLIKIMLMIKV